MHARVRKKQIYEQCDRIGRIFAIWARFLGIGRIFSENYRPNDLGAIFFKIIPQNSPYSAPDLGYFLSINSQILTRNFFLKKVLIY
jgi:prolipoprotein diacylglyceryltransferase